MQRSVRPAVIASLLFLVVFIVPVSALAVITVSPAVVHRGETITMSINDLKDGQSFSLQIKGTFKTLPGESFSFETHQFTMPFALNTGTVSGTTEHTMKMSFVVEKKGDDGFAITKYIRPLDPNDPSGICSFSQDVSLPSGVFDTLKLGGSARTDTTKVISTIGLFGYKKGIDPSKITFKVDGFDNGEIDLKARVDNAPVLDEKVVVGEGMRTPTPTQTTTVPTATATTAVTTTTTTAQPTGSVTEITTTETTPPATETTRVPGTNPTPTASGTAIPTTTFYSADRKVSLTAQVMDDVALMMVGQISVPDSWLMVSRAYALAPDTLAFSPHATISFVTPASGNDYAYFIGRRISNDWVAVPSTAGTGTINGEVDLAGTYALMAFRPESTIQPTIKGTAQATTTPTPLVTVTTKPKIASIAQAAPSPNAAPTRTPLDIMVVAGALATGIALFARARR